MTFQTPFVRNQLFELAPSETVGCQIVGPTQNAWSLVLFDLTQVPFTSSSRSLVLALDRRGAQYSCSVYSTAGLLATATAAVTGPLTPATFGVFDAHVQVESVLVIDAQ